MAFTYQILCPCGRPATRKIAARWSDGLTHELKTYGLVCETCLPAKLAAARAKQAACPLAEGETVGPPEALSLPSGPVSSGLSGSDRAE